MLIRNFMHSPIDKHKEILSQALPSTRLALFPVQINQVDSDTLGQYIDEQIAAFSQTKLAHTALEDLRRIWQWPPEAGVDYHYPSKRDWFDTEESIGKRIADTR